MLKFIIRLDDACPNMDKEKWDRIEKILDKYNIKPIVGIIPDNKDEEFCYEYINNFWSEYAQKWQLKGWIIAQHGLNHNLNKKIRTEFKNKSYEEQMNILKKGNEILKKNNICPSCFFAPAHTFDNKTVDACSELGCFKFISDGYAFYPYRNRKMLFLPCVFDTPHKISNFGVFTFVYHPNKMKDSDFDYLEKFILQNKENFYCDIDKILEKYSSRKKNILDYMLQFSIFIFRGMRYIIKGE